MSHPFRPTPETSTTPPHAPSPTAAPPELPLLDFTTDLAFKLLFVRAPDALRAMLSAVLGEQIDSLTILDPHILGDLSLDSVGKLIVLDVRVVLATGKRILVEMQMRATDDLAARWIFYTARDLGAELERGGAYRRLTPTVLVAWLGERMFVSNPEYLHRVFELREQQSGELLSDHLAVHVLQLPDFKKPPLTAETPAAQAVRRWARFLLAKTYAELTALIEEDSAMETAVNTALELSQDSEAVRLTEERQIAVRLYHHAMAVAEQKGEAKGKAEGEAKGKAEGEAKGQRQVFERLLQRRFGPLSEETQTRLTSATPEQLELWVERFLDAQHVEDVFTA
jgi:predicted transposase/invertase (TIGR01784 family)